MILIFSSYERRVYASLPDGFFFLSRLDEHLFQHPVLSCRG